MAAVKPGFSQQAHAIARSALAGSGWQDKTILKIINAGDGRAIIKLDKPISITVDRRILKPESGSSSIEVMRLKLLDQAKNLSHDLDKLIDHLGQE